MSAVASGILMCWGNWNLLEEDVTGNGSYGDPSDTEDARDHNYANEIEDRQWGSLGSALDFEHDAAGNTREKPLSSTAEFRYTHDAWNRLVKIEEVVSGSPTTITEQAFNGLHWRTVLKQDTTQVRDGLDQVRRQYYDASWRLIFESIDDGWSSGFAEDRVVEQFWGLRYIDDAVLRRVKSTGGSEGDYTRHHYLTDVQFSVVAVMASNGGVVERVRYTPYGEARHFWRDDVNGDRQTDFFDFLDLQDQVGEPEPYIGGDDYVVEMDLDRDGDIDSDDWNLIGSAKSALPSGWISDAGSSGLDNQVGYDGYLFLPASEQYHVRARTYDPELGRWLERDPAVYVDGMSLYQYGSSSPVVFTDASGLDPARPGDNPRDVRVKRTRETTLSNCSPWSSEASSSTPVGGWFKVYGNLVKYHQINFAGARAVRYSTPRGDIYGLDADTGSVSFTTTSKGWHSAGIVAPPQGGTMAGAACMKSWKYRITCSRTCDCAETWHDEIQVLSSLYRWETDASSQSSKRGTLKQSCSQEIEVRLIGRVVATGPANGSIGPSGFGGVRQIPYDCDTSDAEGFLAQQRGADALCDRACSGPTWEREVRVFQEGRRPEGDVLEYKGR